MKLLIVGSTGLVGRHVLDLALADRRIASVACPVRRSLPAHPKLMAPLVDYNNLPRDASWWQVDAVICALGTTMRVAGSRAAFRRVDYEYPLAVARLARDHGARAFVLNSAIGADSSSRFFYNQVKGDLELELARLYFSSVTYVRPGLIGGEREEFRAGERALVAALSLLDRVVPQRWRINPANRIAHALLQAAIEARPGIQVVPSDRLV
ncbi:NAD-dependent dehydratase [Ensifer sp. ENS12]|uniref:NAD-dependent dehydratase n=1 Tax=Ensifer sp. ENS12 TaxID=2854774 RepID=UPI001C48B162|nr:NAD-dependent dehydratase [Ensifer sp. ENS12]MBV7519054.1 NAD-dependent dehydratase [Ensifer sp. ENS12]